MAGRTRLLAALIALTACGTACSNNNEADAAPPATESSTTTTVAPTTTTIATTTTLSERAIVEAEVEQLVTDFWLAPFDTSTGEDRLEYLTGLTALRLIDGIEQLEAQGQLIRNQGQESIEITGSQVDLEKGEGEVEACTGSSGERLDIETMERVTDPEDAEYLTITVFYVELTDDGWKINDLVGSIASESPEICEIEIS